MTAANTFQRAPESASHTVSRDSIYCILGTRRGEPARVRRQKGGDKHLVGAQNCKDSHFHVRVLTVAVHIFRHIELMSSMTL